MPLLRLCAAFVGHYRVTHRKRRCQNFSGRVKEYIARCVHQLRLCCVRNASGDLVAGRLHRVKFDARCAEPYVILLPVNQSVTCAAGPLVLCWPVGDDEDPTLTCGTRRWRVWSAAVVGDVSELTALIDCLSHVFPSKVFQPRTPRLLPWRLPRRGSRVKTGL